MSTDIIVQFRDLPDLNIELYQTSFKQQYKDLVKRNALIEPATYRDPCHYSPELLNELAYKAKEIFGWEWIDADYTDFRTTMALHKELEVLAGTDMGYQVIPREHRPLVTEIHHCLHSLEIAVQQNFDPVRRRGAHLQLEWFVDDGFPLPEDFEFSLGWKFGDIKLQNPFVGHPPIQVYKDNDYENVSQTCKFHNYVRPGIIPMLNSHTPAFDANDYLSWFRANGADFLAKFGEERTVHYAGWPIVGCVTNLDDLVTISRAPSVVVESVVVID